MSYDISFRVKVEGLTDRYVTVGDCDANITWNLLKMIEKSTGIEWTSYGHLGLCKDILPHIADGLAELIRYPEKYKQYESTNGWGTVEGCKKFFTTIINDWNDFCEDCWTRDLADVTYFWIT
jgi:hypothetical protein